MTFAAKKFKAALLALTIVFTAVPALAVTDSGYVTIAEIQLNPGWPGVLVRYSANMKNTDACGRADWYYLPKTHAQYQDIYTLLLAARTAEKQVRFSTSGCQAPSGATAPAISGVYL